MAEASGSRTDQNDSKTNKNTDIRRKLTVQNILDAVLESDGDSLDELSEDFTSDDQSEDDVYLQHDNRDPCFRDSVLFHDVSACFYLFL